MRWLLVAGVCLLVAISLYQIVPSPLAAREKQFRLRPGLFGHNGLGALFPEDSLANLCFIEHYCQEDWCKDLRNTLQGIEFDVQLSADNRLILRHDDHVRDLLPFNASLPETINEYTARDIRQLDLRSGYCRSLVALRERGEYHSVVPSLLRAFCEENSPCASDLYLATLDEAIERVQGLSHSLQIGIEIKPNIANSTTAVQLLGEMFHANPELYENAFVMGFVPQVLHAVKRTDNNIATGWIIRRTLLNSLCESQLLHEKSPWTHGILCDVPYVHQTGDFIISSFHRLVASFIGLDFICPHFEYVAHLPPQQQAEELARWSTFLRDEENQIYMWGVNFDHLTFSERAELVDLFDRHAIAYTTHTWPLFY